MLRRIHSTPLTHYTLSNHFSPSPNTATYALSTLLLNQNTPRTHPTTVSHLLRRTQCTLRLHQNNKNNGDSPISTHSDHSMLSPNNRDSPSSTHSKHCMHSPNNVTHPRRRTQTTSCSRPTTVTHLFDPFKALHALTQQRTHPRRRTQSTLCTHPTTVTGPL